MNRPLRPGEKILLSDLVAACGIAAVLSEIQPEQPPNPHAGLNADGFVIRHDWSGFYFATEDEAEHEGEGNPSVGFDGRSHFRSINAAIDAYTRRYRP